MNDNSATVIIMKRKKTTKTAVHGHFPMDADNVKWDTVTVSI